MSNKDFKEEYPIQDDTWPSRRWNKDKTDYIDLSGPSDIKFQNYKTKDIVYIVDSKAAGMGISAIGKTFVIYKNEAPDSPQFIMEHQEFYSKHKKL